MALRPIAFSIPSTTELKITFSLALSNSISVDHISIESLSGNTNDLEVLGVEIDNEVLLITTRPQIAGNFYLLKFLDTAVPFESLRGDRLIDDSVSRDLFFIGIDNVNPFRDRMLATVPNFFSLENSVIKNVLTAQAEEFYRAQKNIGSVLANNYISELVTDELRTRTAGATDRLANENAFEIIRVAKTQTNFSEKFKLISFNSSAAPRLTSFPDATISLQQKLVELEEISSSSIGNRFDGFRLTIKNKNILKLLYVKLVAEDDEEDCNGDIGTEYDIEKFKYTILSNIYDPQFSFSFLNLNSDEIILSEFGNITKPKLGDKIYVSYLYKDLGIQADKATLDVYMIAFAENESIPANCSSFFLKNASVSSSSGEEIFKSGLSFYTNENNTATPDLFKTELVFNTAKLPSKPGEWSCNYVTGEVFVYGESSILLGTQRNTFVVSYYYRYTFLENIDYVVREQDLAVLQNRNVIGEEINVAFSYEEVYAPGTDFDIQSHIEILGEHVENRVNQSFSFYTEQTPITNVFRIYNETTGEVYLPLWFTDHEVYFSGNKSPEITQIVNEKSNFKKISQEEIQVIDDFTNPCFKVRITSAETANTVFFTPGIPAEFINIHSDDYLLTTTVDDLPFDDYQISYFDNVNSENLTNQIILSGSQFPDKNDLAIIGPRVLKFVLGNVNILNQNNDALGGISNSSVIFDNIIFENEVFGSEDDLTRLRNVGEYCIDYKYGVVFVAVSKEQDYNLDAISYVCATHITSASNVLTAGNCSLKSGSNTELVNANIVYEDLSFDSASIKIDAIQSTFTTFDGETTALNSSQEFVSVCEVQEDYTVVVPYPITSISAIYHKTDVEGANFTSSKQSDRIKNKTAKELRAANLYHSDVVSFENNIIDLKKSAAKSAYANTDGDFEINIHDSSAKTFVKAIRLTTDTEYIHDDYTIDMMSVYIVHIESGTEFSTLSIDSDADLPSITSSYFLVDSAQSRFRIYAVDSDLSEIVIYSDSENTDVDVSLGAGSIVLKAEISTPDSLKIVIPEEAGLSSGEKFEIIYLTSDIPEIGAELTIDYRYGFIFFDYVYVKDNLVVWYEYGDNALDWSISNRLSEGEQYFATYRYGALREALRQNFGQLTNIDALKTFPLDLDREAYRAGIQAVMHSIPNGPTIPTLKHVANLFTGVDPKIDELVFGQWILNRDDLSHNELEVSGPITFGGGKFAGFKLDEGTSIISPSVSTLPIREGTFECWVRPDWAGIENDANITFNFSHLGREKFSLRPNQNLFDKGFELIPDSFGKVFFSGIGTDLHNFQAADSSFSAARTGTFYSMSTFSASTNSYLEIDARIDAFGLMINDTTLSRFDKYKSYYALQDIYFYDGNVSSGFEFGLRKVSGFSYSFEDLAATTDETPYFNQATPTLPCKCSSDIDINDLTEISNLKIEIDLSDDFDVHGFTTNYRVQTNNVSALVLADEAGNFYSIAYVIANGKKTTKIPNTISKIGIYKIPLNRNKIVTDGYDSIEAFSPTGRILLFAKTLHIPASIQSEEFFGTKDIITDWSSLKTYKIIRSPSTDVISVFVNQLESKYFYHESDLPKETSTGLYLVSPTKDMLVSFYVLKLSEYFDNIFSIQDIYIGADAVHPTQNNFILNKDSSSINPVGLPKNIDSEQGIFIWYDELCTNPLSEISGQWIMRTQALHSAQRPINVAIDGSNYSIMYESYNLDKVFSGKILTDGEFGSIIRAKRNEGNCISSENCSKRFRYCGNGLLDESGWNQIEESQSDLVNTLIYGTQTTSVPWIKVGDFRSSCSNGIYRLATKSPTECLSDPIGNLVYTEISCADTFDISISSKVLKTEVRNTHTGLIPFYIKTERVEFKLEFAVDVEPYVNILGSENNVIGQFAFNWQDLEFHTIRVVKTKEVVDFYMDSSYVASHRLSDFPIPSFESGFINPCIAIFLQDISLANSNNEIMIDKIDFYSATAYDTDILENTDILFSSDSSIEFSFTIDSLDSDGYDGYDGYEEALTFDEVFFSSDKEHYLIDCGDSANFKRFSIFKNGKGFLNFRIFDQNKNLLNLSKNIKDWRTQELHHIAASWKLNSFDEKDEMHLFVDGQEVPNLYKFGGVIPVLFNTKFSDVGREYLQNFLVKKIQYCPEFVGATLANSSTFSANESIFLDEHVGRSLLFKSSNLYPDLVGEHLVIKTVINERTIILCKGDTLNEFIATTSASAVDFFFAPFASNLSTDVKNTKTIAYKTSSSGEIEEFGGIYYSVENGAITILSGENVDIPKYRVHTNLGIIEFIGKNNDCLFEATVNKSDISIYIETYGLNLQKISQTISLNSSSYISDDSLLSGKSILKYYGVEPIQISDVFITKEILKPTSIQNQASNGYAEFEISLEDDNGFYTLSSQGVLTSKQNFGRKISVKFESDLIDYCAFDGYSDGYGEPNIITVYGTTTDGSGYENFPLSKNGIVAGEKFFKTITSVSGVLQVIDDSYFELGVIEIFESDSIFIQNNNGDYAELLSYKNGYFEFGVYGSNGSMPFELPPGYYRLEYTAFLTVPFLNQDPSLYIGADFNKENFFNGVIDEFRILSEISSDTRSTENVTVGQKTITSDFNQEIPFCPDSTTTSLIHFKDPIDEQIRILRFKRFYDAENNLSYGFSPEELETLSKLIHEKTSFMSKMISYGFSLSDALQTHTEAFYANGNIILDEAKNYHITTDLMYSSESVNSKFDKSGVFHGSTLLLQPDSNQLRTKEGAVEFWVSPMLDTDIDFEKRYYIDSYAMITVNIESSDSHTILLPSAAKEILKITLLTKERRYESLYTSEDKTSILFDEIERSKLSGILEGGTGIKKDFAKKAEIQSNRKLIKLADALPGDTINVLVSYLPVSTSGDRLSIFKDENGYLNFYIKANGIEHLVNKQISWRKNSWHKILCNYKTNSDGLDTMRIFVDGESGGLVRFGQGLLYGTQVIFGQYLQREGQSKNVRFNIKLSDTPRQPVIGSDIFGDSVAMARLDNIRFSSKMRPISKDSLGNYIDTNYSEDTTALRPLQKDDITTYLEDFDQESELHTKSAHIIDPKNGVFDFDITVIDKFHKVIGVQDGLLEMLIKEILYNLKPSHTNMNLSFSSDNC